MDTVETTLGQRIETCMKCSGFTQATLANALHMPLHKIRSIIRNEITPELFELEEISHKVAGGNREWLSTGRHGASRSNVIKL
jgi:ribosome-binding protein aMBF1 (putative translation factor)